MVLALTLTSCSLVDQYLPSTENKTGDDVLIIDGFNFTDEDTVTELPDIVEVENETDTTTSGEANETISEENATAEEELAPETAEDLIFTSITVTEGDLVSLAKLIAQDPDGDEITYTYSAPFNEFGLWQTNNGDEGKYLVTLTASDGVLSTTEQVRIIVEASNKGPVIDCPDYFIVSEGEFIDLPCTIYDREGDEVTFAVSGFMDELTYQTTYEDAGEYSVVITATDGAQSTIHEMELFINEQNRPPVVEEIDTLYAEELETVVVNVVATDPDNEPLTVYYPILFDEQGKWKTTRGDAGQYNLEVTVTDGVNDVIVPLEIIISEINVAPQVEALEPIIVQEGETITLDVVATDADGDDLTFTFSGFMDTATYTTTYDDAGEHEVIVTVSDGLHDVSTTVSIIVENVNRPPVFILK